MTTTHEIIERIAKASRRLRMGQRLPDGPLPWDVVQRVQADFRRVLDQPGISLTDVAEAMGEGFSRGTLSRFKNMIRPDDSTVDLDRVVRGINQFLETLARRRQVALPDTFVETEVARRILLVIAKTIELSAIGLIYGDAGRGKTLTLKAAAAIHTGAILIRVTQSTRTPSSLAKHLAQLLQLRGAETLLKAESKLIEKLSRTGRPLLIDEAHQLKPEALELLRDLHDECGVPVILVGTVKINEAVADSDLFCGQFSSRVAIRYDITECLRSGDGGRDPQPLHTIEEIKRLYASDKIRFTADGLTMITKLANLPGFGGLRLCSKIVQVAATITGDDPVDARLVMQIIRSLHGRTHTISQIERAIDRSDVLVA